MRRRVKQDWDGFAVFLICTISFILGMAFMTFLFAHDQNRLIEEELQRQISASK